MKNPAVLSEDFATRFDQVMSPPEDGLDFDVPASFDRNKMLKSSMPSIKKKKRKMSASLVSFLPCDACISV